MAERRRLRFGRRPELTVSAVAIGAVTAGFGLTPATANPDYPSWDDVQDAQGDEAAAQAEIENLNGLLDGLEASAAEATRTQQIAAERYRIAQTALDEAIEQERELKSGARKAEEKAAVSKMRAGLLAAHLSRQAGGDVGLNLGISGDADGLLYQLSAVGKLTEQSAGIYAEALADRNAAESLRSQAESAADQRRTLAADAEEILAEAEDAAEAAESAVAEQESRQNELLAQLAAFKGTTAATEAQYRAGVAAREAAARAPAAAPPPPRPPAGATGGTPNSAGANPGGTNTGGSNPGGSTPTQPPAQPPSQPVVQPPPSQPVVQPPPAAPAPQNPPPATDKVASAIAFARSQLGDAYQLGGSGPDRWDCSGLTKAAYAAAGINIGTHSATNQYYTAQSRGQLVPYAQRQPGDLIFWTDGSSMYHVAIYTGGGMMIEAPNPSALVRERGIWGAADVVGYVARPTA
ncbi:MAG TPA: NlpC/P60 family protein [Naasia sp.]